MILLRSSVLLLFCGIFCCQESVTTASPINTTQLHPTGQQQESLLPTITPEDSPRENEAEKLAQSENETVVDDQTEPKATPDDLQFIARRRKCCEDGRQHFYKNGNCANRSREENEAVGLWCDQKFLDCCVFMEAYYMGPVDGCRGRNKLCRSQLPTPGTLPEGSPRGNEAEKSVQPENVTVVDSRESQTKPSATPDDLQFIARRRKCCEDGRQHFYKNGNCANRSREENEAVGLWCDQKFLDCCVFMEAYYMGPVDGCRGRNKPCRSQLPTPGNLPEGSPTENKVEKSVQPENVTVVDSRESQTKPSATAEATLGGENVTLNSMSPTNNPLFISKRRKCCEDGRQHFYMNGNCANRPREKNEAVGLWCDQKFLDCCVFMEAYYMGPVDACRNKQCHSQLPSPTDTSRVTNTPLN
ncbi:unnamed protein product [Staurois parvus]|uniref:Uncharacterized protein n=1 Tax=Staurois parvus TaxID=386267 RepID=A0ABN9BZV7_9NEOB|nr:unnamed protein product [Staurois parvus]